MKTHSRKELIDSVYDVALQPNRYEELTLIWNERLKDILLSRNEPTQEFADDLQRSLQILQMVTYDELQGKPPLSEFETSRFAVLAVTETGEILDGNPAAQAAFSNAERQTIFNLPFDQGSLDAIHAAVAKSVQRPKNNVELIRAVKIDHDGQSLISVRFNGGALDNRPFAILQTSDFYWPESLLPLLKSAFNLTQAEAEITRMVTEGMSLSAVAEHRQSSLATVRTQMRSIFQKTETHGQTELVRMAIAFVALYDKVDDSAIREVMTAPPEAEPQNLIYPRNEDRHVLSLPDGRRLDYSVIGDPNGYPVLHIAPVFWADFWSGKHIGKLADSGLKLIAPARPGYFRSSICPDGQSPAEQYAQDALYLLSELGHDKCSILTRGMGAMFAYELAYELKHKIDGMVLIGPEIPFETEDVYQDVSPGHRFILAATLKYPKLLELYISAARIYFKRARTRAFIEKNFANAKADLHLLDDPHIMQALRAGLDATYASGTKAVLQCYQDVRNYRYDRVVACQTPATVVLGFSDASPRRAITKKMIADGAKLDLVELDDVAEFCFHAKPDLIISYLTDLKS